MNKRLFDYARSAAFRMELSSAMLDALRYHATIEATAPKFYNRLEEAKRSIRLRDDFSSEGAETHIPTWQALKKRGLLEHKVSDSAPCWRVTRAGWLVLALLKEAGYEVMPPEPAAQEKP